MANPDVLRAFVEATDPPGDPSLTVEGDKLVVDGWWPAALRLGPRTCLVRVDDGPDAGLPVQLVDALSDRGLVEIEAADLGAPVLAVAMQRMDVLAALWQVWSEDEATARSVIGDAATG